MGGGSDVFNRRVASASRPVNAFRFFFGKQCRRAEKKLVGHDLVNEQKISGVWSNWAIVSVPIGGKKGWLGSCNSQIN